MNHTFIIRTNSSIWSLVDIFDDKNYSINVLGYNNNLKVYEYVVGCNTVEDELIFKLKYRWDDVK